MSLNENLFGQGTQATDFEDPSSGMWGVASPGNLAGQGPNSALRGSNMANNYVSQNTPGVNSNIYQNAMNLANAQAANYQGMGNQALQRSSPMISNPDAGAMRGQFAALNSGYNGLNSSLSNTAAGGGINSGQAQYAGAQSQGIQAAMQQAAARQGGGMRAALSPAASGFGQAGAASGAARGQQVSQAQSGLANGLAAQGQMNLGIYSQQNQAALQQAQLQAAQNAQNDQYAMNLYGLSQGQQNAAVSANQTYNQGAISTANAGTAHQQTQNQQTLSDIGLGAAAGGAFLAAM